jgi:probable rRNA maturation factor
LSESSLESGNLLLEIAARKEACAIEPDIHAILSRAIVAANDIAGPAPGDVSVLVESDEYVRDLNRQWRNIDKPTNVLSFPGPAQPRGAERHIGDIAISHETAAREAAEERKPFAHHISHLAVHGFLHLLGYDHMSEDEAERMEALERRILARLNVPDPYLMHEPNA